MKIITLYTRLYHITVIAGILVISAVIAFFNGSASGESGAADTIAPGGYVVGTLAVPRSMDYVIVEELKTGKKRLYSRVDYQFIKHNKDIRFIRSLYIDRIEYRYSPVEGKVDFVSNLFEFVSLEGDKAVLQRDYSSMPEAAFDEQERPGFLEEATMVDKPFDDESGLKPMDIKAKRLVSSYFYQIRTKKLSENEWEVELPTILNAMSNFANVLKIVTEKITGILEANSASRVFFNTAIGKGVLGSEGLVVESLSSRLRGKFGIKDDDLITSVNGKALNNIQGVGAIFSGIDPGSPQTVSAKITGGEAELVNTYYLK